MDEIEINEILNISAEELDKKTARELYKIAQGLRVKNYTHFKKPELIDEILKALREYQREKSAESRVEDEPQNVDVKQRP